MTDQLSSRIKSSPIGRTRRNHALEHATLQILSGRYPKKSMAGYSMPEGFWIVGDVPTQDVQQAVDEARARLSRGEYSLAVHPNCGTNFALSGLAAGGAAWLALLGANSFHKKWERLPLAVMFATLAIIVTRPLGPLVQARYTTDAHIGGLQVTAIYRHDRPELVLHHILTRS